MREDVLNYNFFKKPADLKFMAKEGLRGNRGKSLAINLVFFLSKLCFYASLTFFIIILINLRNYDFNLILYAILAMSTLLITILTFGPLKISCCYHSINMVENTSPKFADIFFGFKNRYFRNVGYSFSLFFIYLLNLILLIVPFVNKYIHYQISGYILAEDINKSVGEALKLSTDFSKGHSKKFIKLFFSFFGEFLLCIPTAYIYSLWLRPKYSATVYCYYKDIKK